MKPRHFALLLLLVGLLRPVVAGAQDPLAEARRALEEARADVATAQEAVDEAQQKANRAGEDFFAAIEEQEALELEVAELEVRQTEAQAELDALSHEVRTVVVDQYVGAQRSADFLDDGDLNRSVRAEALSRYVANSRLDALDEYRLLRARLEDFDRDLAARQARQVELVALMAESESAANAALAELTAEREQLDAKVADLEAEEARLVAEAEARRQAEEEERRREEAARVQAEESASGGDESENPQAEQSTPPANPDSPAVAEPTTEPQPPVVTNPAPATGWVCPVAGPSNFIDSWGAPRAVGRWHQATDMMAAEGIPVVAVVDGTLEHRGNSVGGLSAHLTATNGTYFYYTHLSGYANEGAGFVSQGTVIGYVGMTGNAPVPHLHFEHHPGGRGNPVNPYPTLIASC